MYLHSLLVTTQTVKVNFKVRKIPGKCLLSIYVKATLEFLQASDRLIRQRSG